jgi:Flp pilus assembly CpaF family ATPase
VLTANVGLPHHSIREAIALAIHLVVHIARVDGRRRVMDVLAIRGYDTRTDQFALTSHLTEGVRASHGAIA